MSVPPTLHRGTPSVIPRTDGSNNVSTLTGKDRIVPGTTTPQEDEGPRLPSEEQNFGGTGSENQTPPSMKTLVKDQGNKTLKTLNGQMGSVLTYLDGRYNIYTPTI